MPSRLLSLIALLCLTVTLQAQKEAPARYQIYGGYSYLSNSLNGVPGAQQGLNGWVAAVAFPSWRGLRFKIDVSAYSGTNTGAQQHPYYIMGGGEYSRRIGRETVYVEGLAGDGGINRYWGPNQLPGETASFVSLLGGGVDTPITRHIAFRVDGGYQYSNFALINNVRDILPYRIPGQPNNFGRLSTGLVWNF